MIEGVTVLNSEFVDTSCIPIAVFLYILAGIVASFVIAFIILLIKHQEPAWLIGILLCGLMCVGMFFAAQDIRIGEQYTQYELVVSEDVSINEFMANYEILEQRGEIYVIRENLDNATSQ